MFLLRWDAMEKMWGGAGVHEYVGNLRDFPEAVRRHRGLRPTAGLYVGLPRGRRRSLCRIGSFLRSRPLPYTFPFARSLARGMSDAIDADKFITPSATVWAGSRRCSASHIIEGSG